jgi:hypothetical protein
MPTSIIISGVNFSVFFAFVLFIVVKKMSADGVVSLLVFQTLLSFAKEKKTYTFIFIADCVAICHNPTRCIRLSRLINMTYGEQVHELEGTNLFCFHVPSSYFPQHICER